MPFDYATTALVEEAMQTTTVKPADTAYIGKLITRVSRRIDKLCNRQIVAEATTRYFHAHEDVHGDDLLLDTDLVSVTTLTNGDGIEITSDEYVLLPTNETPKFGIRLKSDSSKSWTWVNDPNEAISVEGLWGYASNTPDDIVEATIGLVVYWYKSRKNPFLEVGTQQGGLALISPSVPGRIADVLEPYIKQEFPAV